MSTWVWIVLAVVVILVVAFGIGLARARSRRVSLRDAPPSAPAVTEGPPAKGGYKARGSSISFSSGSSPVGSGTATAPRPPVDRPRADRPQDRPPVVKPLPEPTTPADTAGPAAAPTAPPTSPPTSPPATPPADRTAAPTSPTAPTAPGTDPTPTLPSATDRATTGSSPADTAHPVPDRPEIDGQPGVGDDASVPRDAPSRSIQEVELPDFTELEKQFAQPEPIPDPETLPPPVAQPQPTAPTPPVPPAPPVSSPAPAPAPAPGPEAGPAEQVREVIDPSTGRLVRLRGRLSRSQNAFGRSMLGLLGAGTLDEDSWTDVEDTLLLADLGAGAAAEITEKLRTEVARHGITDAAGARALLRRVMIEAVSTGPGIGADRSVRALPHDGRPSVLLIVGVNGTGKTTTTGKLARVLVADGRHVVLGAADTFRAAAADQLQTWAERSGAVVVRAEQGTDPASVAFDAVKRGIADGADAVLIDTAGRLHTKTGLMDELGKVKRVIEKQAEVDEVLLVLDATTGQNGLVQATVFAEVVQITGIVLTKLDGTAKGGIVVAVQRALGVPVKLVGLGEGPDDLAPFEPEAFVDALLGD